MKIVNEGIDTTKTITLTNVSDPDDDIEKLIKYVDENSRGGHSFWVVVDPDSENERKFYIDGDGAARLGDIKVEEESDE